VPKFRAGADFKALVNGEKQIPEKAPAKSGGRSARKK
jgi:hypothetical protein